MNFGVIIHGGAWDIPDNAVEDHLNGVQSACRKAYDILASGGSSIDAVEQSIMLMEENPTFDAGKGSFVNQIGEVEMDAIIASDDYKIGSVCAVQNIFHPIQLARLVRDKTEHVMIVGKGANKLAQEHGIFECNPEELLVGRELERYYEIKKMLHFEPKEAFGKISKPNGMGTVGCVCLDKSGQFAIGVSTGGTPYKRAGRIGDTPIWGSGAYVNKQGGIAATGFGEDLIRVMISKMVSIFIEQGLSAQESAILAINSLEKEVRGLGGVVVLDRFGVGFAFNTPRMAYAFLTDDNPNIHFGINP